jgi:hypothetical protein
MLFLPKPLADHLTSCHEPPVGCGPRYEKHCPRPWIGRGTHGPISRVANASVLPCLVSHTEKKLQYSVDCHIFYVTTMRNEYLLQQKITAT